MKNSEFKDCKLLLNIALVFQMLYLVYVCFINVFRKPVVFLLDGFREVESKVFVDVPYLIGIFIITGIIVLWYCIINDKIKKGKTINALYFVVLYISFYFGYQVIPNEAYQFQYSYIGNINFSRNDNDLFYDSWSYALNLSTVEKLGKGLFALAVLFILCALLIYWTKCRYKQNNIYGTAAWGEEENNIIFIMRIALFFQFVYLGYILFYNLFRTVTVASYRFGNGEFKVFFDFPYVLGAILSTVIMVNWYLYLKKAVKRDMVFAFSHLILLGITYIIAMYIIPFITSLIQILISRFLCSQRLFGASYADDSNTVILVQREVGVLDTQLYALIFLICAFTLSWVKKKYAVKQTIEQ